MKRFIQVFSFLGLALIFSAATANAQTVNKIDANIPFSFSVGDKPYEAGTYQLKIQSIAAGGALVTIFDSEHNSVQSVLAVNTGETAKSKAELVFEKQNGQRSLTAITLPYTGLQIGSSKSAATTITKNKIKTAEPTTKKS